MKSNLFESGSKKTIATQTDYSLGSATCFPNVVCAPSYDNSGFPTMFRNYSGVITPEELMRHQEVTNELNLMKTKDNSKKLHKELIGDLFEGQLNVYVTYCKDMEMGDCTDVVYKNILLKDFTFSDIFYVCTNLYSNQDYIYTIKDDRNCSLREFLQGISSTNEKIEITGLDLKNHLKFF